MVYNVLARDRRELPHRMSRFGLAHAVQSHAEPWFAHAVIQPTLSCRPCQHASCHCTSLVVSEQDRAPASTAASVTRRPPSS